MFSNKKLIIFDMDGTLIDSAPSLAFALNFTLQQLGKRPFSEETIREWIGNGADILIKRALVGSKDYEQFRIDKELFGKAKTLFLKFYGNNLNAKTTLYPDVPQTLSRLKESGFTLALATNKPVKFVADMLEHFNIMQYFTLAYGAGSVEHKKPHPQILLTLCKELHIPPAQSVMVGDSSNDLLAANAAGIDTIALTYGYNQGVDLKELAPTLLCDNFKDIVQHFGIQD